MMLFMKLLQILSLTELTLSFSSNISSKYKLIDGRCPVSGVDVFDHLIRRSAIHCATSCTNVVKCRGIIYRSTKCDDVTTEPGSCWLISYDKESSVVLGPSNSTSDDEFYVVDPCWSDHNPCLNGGMCNSSQWPVIVCECSTNYSGNFCEIDVRLSCKN